MDLETSLAHNCLLIFRSVNCFEDLISLKVILYRSKFLSFPEELHSATTDVVPEISSAPRHRFESKPFPEAVECSYAIEFTGHYRPWFH